jgi:small GTP-binding protein
MSFKKVLIVGDAGVGKTNLINAIFKKPFNKQYIATNRLTVYESGQQEIYDWPGQNKFNITSFPEDIDVYIIVYDVTNSLSYESVSFWKTKKEEFYDAKVPTIIIGNKIDMGRQRKINDSGSLNISVKKKKNIPKLS